MKIRNVILRIQQKSSFGGVESQAWGLDNFVILSPAVNVIDEDFDPTDSCNFLSASGDNIKVGVLLNTIPV